MTQIYNYNSKETLATGFVKPKITSLFFDKIWLPKSLTSISHEYSDIPNDVLVREESELQIRSDNIISGDYYKVYRMRNKAISPGEFYEFMLHSNAALPEDFLSKIENDDPRFFKTSNNRNHAIFVSAENFSRQYNLYISPVFHDLTEFEKEIKSISYDNLNDENIEKRNNQNNNAYSNRNALTVSIQDFPTIIEEKLSWEQVLDFRKDKKNISKLKKFTDWSSKKFENKSQNEIRETLEKELDDYNKALKEHGIKTAVGTFSTIVSSANAINSLVSGTNPILPLLSVSTILLAFSVNTYFSNLKNQNNPIAYIYDIKKSFS